MSEVLQVDSAWSGVRVSFGMNGILLPCGDLLPLAEYLLQEQINMPVDLLTDEWHMKVCSASAACLTACCSASAASLPQLHASLPAAAPLLPHCLCCTPHCLLLLPQLVRWG